MTERERRAAERQRRMIGGLLTGEDLPPSPETPIARLEALHEISLRAWALTGQPVPVWERGAMPGQIRRER